jgi:sugar phosphate isomerase/epimerase
MLEKGLNRREFLMGLAAAGALASIKPSGLTSAQAEKSGKVTICIFSKHLQWLDYDKMAEASVEAGFDGVELVVRPQGHVLPERVEEDLPKAAEAVKKAGTKILAMTTSISNPKDSVTEKVLRTASGLGINYYRLGYWYYNERKSIIDTLEEARVEIRGLTEMNKKYKIYGGNQNHSGTRYLGASVWDIWELIKDLDPNYIGFQYDPQNNLAEGSGGSWMTDARLALSHSKMFVVKTQKEWGSPEWEKSTRRSGNKLEILTPGELDWCFRILKKNGFSGPITAHYEFPGLGGAENGAMELKGVTKKEVLTILKRNLDILKEMLQKAELL